jgi:hypothetical protein
MAPQTIGFGDLEDESQQNQNNTQQNQEPTQTPGAGQSGSVGNSSNQAGPANSTAQNSGQSAGTAPQGGGTATSARPATYNQTNQGTGFTNFQSYLNNNNPSQLQNAVAGNLEGQNQSVLNNLGQAQTQFGQQQSQNQANTNANQQAIQSVLSNPDAFTAVSGTPSAVTTAAQQQAGGTAPTAANLATGNQFSNLLGGQYQGPTALAGQQGLVNQAGAAQQQAQGLQTAAGRQAVLQQMIGAPGYNQGEQQMDAALLGQGSNPQLQAAARQAQGLGGIVQQAGAGATAQGQEQQNASQQFGTQTQGQLGSTLTNLNNTLQQNAATQQAGQNAAYQQLLTDASGNTLTSQEAQLLGLTNGEQITQNDLSNIGQYTNQNPLQATAQNVATSGNYATIDALRQLAGGNAGAAASNVLGQYQGQEGNAGQFSAAPQATVNTAGLNNTISTDTGAYNQGVAQAQGAVNQDQSFADWASGNLTGGDIAQAEQLGYTANELQPGGFGDASAGQALWNNYLNQTYAGTGGIGGNSRDLSSGWAQGQLAQAQAAQQKELASLNSTYGGLDTINVAQPTATTSALQQIAGSPQLADTTINPQQQVMGNEENS